MKRLTTILAGLALLGVTAGTAHADLDVALDVPAPLVLKLFKDQISATMKANPKQGLDWRPAPSTPIKVTRMYDDVMQVNLQLVKGGINVDVLFYVNLVATGNAMITKATGPMLAALWKKLQAVASLPGNHYQNCPHFEVATSGALHAEIDFENGCINGTQTVVPCPAGFEGKGSKWITCGNGELWTRVGVNTCKRRDDVDPPPPPGGAQP
jgi:hypothetical protein